MKNGLLNGYYKLISSIILSLVILTPTAKANVYPSNPNETQYVQVLREQENGFGQNKIEKLTFQLCDRNTKTCIPIGNTQGYASSTLYKVVGHLNRCAVGVGVGVLDAVVIVPAVFFGYAFFTGVGCVLTMGTFAPPVSVGITGGAIGGGVSMGSLHLAKLTPLVAMKQVKALRTVLKNQDSDLDSGKDMSKFVKDLRDALTFVR